LLYFERYVHNHMTKIFSMRQEDRALGYFSPVPTNRDRLEDAKSNLRRVSVIGFQDRLDDLMDQLRTQFGWRIAPVEDQKVSEPVDVSDAFRTRIATDNALDVELYEFARNLS
jgi:hypothetical protein